MKYTIDHRLSDLVEEIYESYEKVHDLPGAKAAAIHRYLYNEIEYVSQETYRGREPEQTARYTWHNGGNCVNQSILAASLFTEIEGTKTRLVSVDYPDKSSSHMFPQIGFTIDPEDVTTHIRRFYAGLRKLEEYRNPHWEEDDGRCWFFADPVNSVTLGSCSRLARGGYIDRERGDSGTEWSYAQSPRYYNTEIQLRP